jgi:IS30 family transposase
MNSLSFCSDSEAYSKGLIPNRISIEKRPSIVSKRKRLGDIEVDFIIGKNY